MISLNFIALLIVYSLTFIITVNGYDEIVECSENTPMFNLSDNTITLLQSPNFPKTFGNSPPSTCHAQFSTDNPTNNIWILMLNGGLSEIQFHDPHNTSNELTTRSYSSNFDVVNFTTTSDTLLVNAFSYNSEIEWAAFQAVLVVYPKTFEGCPLQSRTFDFSTNQDLVIPVTDTFLVPESELGYKLCNWFFTISTNQQLKVVVREIYLPDNITVILRNEKGQLKSFSEDDLDQVFYFDEEKFTFTYEFDYANFSNTGFLAFVSVVNKPISFTMNGCQPPSVDMTSHMTNFTNIDYDHGYPPYQKCENAITIDPNHEAILSITEYSFEGISDKLSLNYGKNASTEITWEPWKQPFYYKLTSDVSGGLLTFTSDGNTQGAGFRALLTPYECQCSNPIVVMHCDFETYLRPMNGIVPYCSNMDCTYMIISNSSCPDKYFSLSFSNRMRDSIDYFIIKDNYGFVENITAAYGNSDDYFSPDNNVTIHFHSGPSSNPVTTEDKAWYLQIKPIPKPNFIKITLDNSTTKYVKWLADMQKNDALTVCTSTGTLEVFIPQLVHFYDLREFFLYDAPDLDTCVGTLNSIAIASTSNSTDPISLKSTSGCFTLYLPSYFPFGSDNSILFRNAEDTVKNCQDSNNIFQVPSSETSSFDVTVESTATGSCEMIILTSDYDSALLSHIWISSITVSDDNGQYKVYSAENNKELFSFKGSEASNFQYIGVYAPALSIVAPPSSSITISMSGVSQTTESINIASEGIQKGVMASPSYSGFMQKFGLQTLYKSNGSSDFTATFNVKEINGNAKPILESDGKNLTLSIGIYTSTNSFSLLYEDNDPANNGFLIEYTIQSGDLPPQISSTASSATSSTSSASTENTGTIFTSISSATIEPHISTTSEVDDKTSLSSAIISTSPSISSSSKITSTTSATISTSKSTSISAGTSSVASSTTLKTPLPLSSSTTSPTTISPTISSTNPSTVSETEPILVSTDSTMVSDQPSTTTLKLSTTTSNTANLSEIKVSLIFISTLFFLLYRQ